MKFLLLIFLISGSSMAFAQDSYNKNIDIPSLEQVEQPALARRCDRKGTTKDQLKCTLDYINDYVNRHFNTSLVSNLMKTDHVDLKAHFLISPEGKVVDVVASGGPERVNSHLVKVLRSLKDFEPAMRDGKAIAVSHSVSLSMKFF